MRKKSILLIVFLIMFSFISSVYALPQNVPDKVNQYNQSAGEESRFLFRNRTRMNLYGNVSMNLSIECDADNVGNKEFNFSYYGENAVKLNISINASNNAFREQERIRTRNGSLYQFRHRIVVNISRNTTEIMKTTIRVNISESNCTWVYYNETDGKYEIIESWYENGYLSANITHFSTYAVIGGIIEDTSEPKWWIIYIAIGTIAIVTLYIVFDKMKQKSICPNGKERLPNGKCPK